MKKSNNEVLRRIGKVGFNPPEALTLLITNGCNLHCRHCLLDCRSHTEIGPVSTQILLRRIKEFAALGGKQIRIAGGEPLCHPDWHTILEFCCRQTGFEEVCLQTNATLLTQNRIRKLLELPAEKLIIQISLDGAGAFIHDYIRGPGSYELTVKGIRRLVDLGLGERVRIAFTEMAHNYNDLPALLEMVDRLGIGGLVSGTLLRGGRAAKRDRVALPVPSQYRDLISRYFIDDRFRELYDRRGNIAAIEWRKGMSTPNANVCTCLKNLFIDANGLLYPCVMMLAQKYAVKVGNDKSLGELIAESLLLWAELPQIGLRRQTELKYCRDCPGKNHCLGGCIGRAYSVSGDFMAVEDRCALRRAVYCWQPYEIEREDHMEGDGHYFLYRQPGRYIDICKS
jgi:radical SAM protein with 4Fe4S-binding SPASM domain